MATINIKRRSFLKYSGLTGAAFVLGFRAHANENFEILNLSEAPASYEFTPNIIIEKSGKITIFNSKPDMGQGTFQSIPTIIAEELEVPLDQVTILQTGGEKKFGPMQFSGGSMSVRSSYHELRKIGASAREMLLTAASQMWNVPVSECHADKGKIHHKSSGKSLSYGELAESAAKLPVTKEPKLKDPKDFKMIGKPMLRPDVPLKSKGQAMFGIDVKVPDMVYASIERCPVFGAKLISFDDSEAKKVKGVQAVLKIDRPYGKYTYTGVAVVADNYWSALKARKTLKVEWDYQGNDAFNSEDYAQKLRSLASTEGVIDKNIGDFDKTFADAPMKLEAFYETPMVSHSPMEPMNCVAHWQAGSKLEIWVSTQVPGDIIAGFPAIFGIKEEDIKLHVMFNGGGFGRRLFNDFIVEAVNISKAVNKPVKLVWTREDDTQQGPFRPMTFSALKAGLDNNGKAIAFQHKVIAPSIDDILNKDYDKKKPDETMLEGVGTQKYEFPNLKTQYVHADFHIPLGYWRAVTSTTLAFAHECFIDEMAVKAGRDPLAYRLEMLTKESDTKRILLKLKEVSNWDKPLPKGWGRGVAQYHFFAGLAGEVVEVSRQGDGSVKIEKVIAVIDLGTVVNPDTVRAQMEGAIVMGITAATKNGITFKGGKAEQSNFHDNPVLRITEMPKIEVHILAEGGNEIKGVGEPGLPPVAPALANAIFNLTGKRIRKMPFDLGGIS
jgi:isoquinoline 1-oxidoreductase beta subunit